MRTRANSPFWRRCIRAGALRLFHAVENNDDARFCRNGEAWLLRELAATWARESAQPVVFDVGANVGDYTQRVLAETARAGVRITVHAVEPSVRCIDELTRRFRGRAEVHVHRAAVGDCARTMRLHATSSGSSLASLIARPGADDNAGEDVAVITLESLLNGAGVFRVDLLKLDVEGFELSALRGLGEWLDPGRVSVIQFEYGGTTLDARASLREIDGLLRIRGYQLAKLFPRALELRQYAPWMDHFCYANFIALPATPGGKP